MPGKYPSSPYKKTGNIVYFARMVDKVRLHQANELHEDLIANIGKAFDAYCCEFLGIRHEDLSKKISEGLSYEALLDWSFQNGNQPTEFQVMLWNGFMTKRGWQDSLNTILQKRIAESGLDSRSDVLSMFDYLDADEGRDPLSPKTLRE
ncbi:MAG: DUF5069 domain-containing protein [Chthoniobacterales bacterium]